jgi:CheY-like chemotaxis protein/anti-sigma regulatory factor (Ser/Thr protein kinase)
VRFRADAKQQQLNVDLDDAWVQADVQRIEEVVEQLLDNAIRYTPADGRIELRLRARGGQACLSVRDSGPGIDAALLPRLFEPFVQGARSIDRRAGGLGIGLTLVKRLVELHRGTIDVRSSAEGTLFEIDLPLLGRTAPPPVHDKKSVIVIDDNADVLDGLRSMLELAGHTVCTATEGNTGLATLIETRPDAAIVDIGLPGINGYELAARSRAAGYGGILIALSGYGQEADRRHSLAAGFDAHMVKPVDPRRLAHVLTGSRDGA